MVVTDRFHCTCNLVALTCRQLMKSLLQELSPVNNIIQNVQWANENLTDLIDWGLYKMAGILHKAFWHAFNWIKMFLFWFKFHWNLGLRDQSIGKKSAVFLVTVWHRTGDKPCLNQCWPSPVVTHSTAVPQWYLHLGRSFPYMTKHTSIKWIISKSTIDLKCCPSRPF